MLVGLGLAVTLVLGLRSGQRRLLPSLVGLAAGFAATAGAAIAIGGPAMLDQLSRESNLVSIVSPWRVIRTLVQLVMGGTAATHMVKAGAIALAVLLAVLFIRGLPGPGETVVFAVVLAWLFAWPYVLPWYDALAWALLPLVPLGAAAADGICWLLLARTTALAFGYLPARQADATLPSGLSWLQPVIRHGVTPAILTVAAVWLAVLMLRARRTGRLAPRGQQDAAHRDEGAVSTATGVQDAAEAGRPERSAWPRRLAQRLAGLPSWAAALGVLAWIAALAAVAPLVRGYLTSAPDQRLVDLDVYRTGGLSVLRGQPLYAMLTQPPQLLAFTYPPAAALFAVPLALMPWPAAQLAWVPFVYVPLAVVIWYAFAPLLHRSGRMRPVAFAAVFAACAYLFPVRDEMRFGQVDMVLLGLAVADCAACRPWWPRGALVGLATAIKLVPGVFIVYLWLSGRRRAALTAALVALACTLGAWLLLPHDSVTYWTSAVFDPGRLGSNAGTSDQSLRGLLLRAFLPACPA